MASTIRSFDITDGWSTRPTPLNKPTDRCRTWHDRMAASGYLLADDFTDKDAPVRLDLWEADDDLQPVPGYLLELTLAENIQLIHCPDELSVLEFLRQYLPVVDRLARRGEHV